MSTTACASASVCGAHLGLAAVRAHTERHDADRRELREAVEHAEQRVVEHRAVVDAGAHDHLAVHLDARVEQELEPAQARRAAPVAQQARAHLGIGRVDAHVERAQLLGDHPLEIGLGEAGERREVSVEKREPVVVVLQVQALAASPSGSWWMKQNGQWLSQVRTRSNTALASSSPSGAPSALSTARLPLEAAPPHVELDLGAVDLQLVARSRRGAASPLTARISSPASDARLLRRGSGRDSKNTSGGHAARLRGRPAITLGPCPCADARRVRRCCSPSRAGFCAGVEMAIKALAWMVRVFEPPVYCYHEIVHNRLVVDRFREQGVIFVDDVDDVPAGAPLMLSAHGSRTRGRRGGPRRGPLRRERGVPARHQGAPRGQGPRPQGLHDPLRRPRRPRRGRRHARGRARRRSGSSSATPTSTRPRPTSAIPTRVAMLAQTTLAHERVDRHRSNARAHAFPRRVDRVAQRPLLRDHEPPGRAHRRSRKRADAVVVIGSANSSNTIALTKVARDAGCPLVLRVDGPDELDLDSSATRASSASPPARARPKSSSTR